MECHKDHVEENSSHNQKRVSGFLYTSIISNIIITIIKYNSYYLIIQMSIIFLIYSLRIPVILLANSVIYILSLKKKKVFEGGKIVIRSMICTIERLFPNNMQRKINYVINYQKMDQK